jgi:hypothetical protein
LYNKLARRNDVIGYDQNKSWSEIQSFSLRAPENEVLTNVSGTKTEEITGAGSNCGMRRFINHTLPPSNKDDAMGETDSTHWCYENCMHNFNGRT